MAVTSSFGFGRDVAGNNTFALPPTEFKYATTLAAGVEQTLDVPDRTQRWVAVFAYTPGASVWVALNNTATIAGGAFAATDSELNPVARIVEREDVLHFITPNTSVEVGVSFYAL